MLRTETQKDYDILDRQVRNGCIPESIMWMDYGFMNGWGDETPMRYEIALANKLPIERVKADKYGGNEIYKCQKLRFIYHICTN